MVQRGGFRVYVLQILKKIEMDGMDPDLSRVSVLDEGWSIAN
jgi:hypothetical protein